MKTSASIVRITGTGSALPEKILTNADMSKIVDTNDEWITTRTGIKERRIASENMATSDLSILAAKNALASAELSASDIDVIIVATCTPDHFFPSVSCIVQNALGAKRAAAFDVSAACSGFIYALSVGKSLLESGAYQRALIIGADLLSKFTDWKDRSTCVLFGDGAGAMVLEVDTHSTKSTAPSILSVDLGADGSHTDILKIPGGGSRHPITTENYQDNPPHIHMDGKEVYKHAVTHMIETANRALEKAGKKPEDLALLIPHQANLRIIESIAKRMNLPMEKVFLNIHKYGNMSAATTIVALDEARRKGQLKSGDLIELIAFGAGLTWGATVIQW
ncbi:MAG: 3-oxoacyl-[acyl-carrier-protein] synthase 3 [Elusimicrobia bacterium]|nr:3-oxoacyl-[acyl-carrier-protein] synthase 3 [Elusimicrobiota bacterium]